MYNRIILIGRLTADPVLKYTPQGTAVATFTLAVNRRYNREETDYIDIVTWRTLAEHCAQYLSKGQQTALEGRLQIRSYEDRNGVRRKVAEVVADDVRFLGRSGNSGGSGSGGGYAQNYNNNNSGDEWDSLGQEVRVDEVNPSRGGMDADDDLPF